MKVKVFDPIGLNMRSLTQYDYSPRWRLLNRCKRIKVDSNQQGVTTKMIKDNT